MKNFMAATSEFFRVTFSYFGVDPGMVPVPKFQNLEQFHIALRVNAASPEARRGIRIENFRSGIAPVFPARRHLLIPSPRNSTNTKNSESGVPNGGVRGRRNGSR